MDVRRAFAPSGFFVLRTPLLPFEDLVGWADGVDPEDEQARATLRGRLRDLVERPHVREAIYVASPAVEELIETWIADPGSERGR